MKKFLLILMSLILVFTLASCKDTTSTENPNLDATKELDSLVSDFLEAYEPKQAEKEVSDDKTPISEHFELPYQFDLSEYITIDRNDYIGITFKKQNAQLTADDIIALVEADLSENSIEKEITDRGAENGDNINIDFKGYVDGEAFENGEAAGYDMVLGEAGFIDGFEDALVGHKTGEEFTIDVTFPEGYSDELGGKPAQFEIKINSIKASTSPEFSESFVTDTLKYSSLEAYLTEKADTAYATKLEETETANKDAAYQALLENVEIIGLPQDMYDHYYNKFVADYEEMAQMYSVDLETLMTSHFGVDMEEFYQVANETADSIVTQELVAFAIGNAENIITGITKGDYDVFLNKLAASYGYDAEAFESTYGKDDIWKSLILDTVINFVIDNAK